MPALLRLLGLVFWLTYGTQAHAESARNCAEPALTKGALTQTVKNTCNRAIVTYYCDHNAAKQSEDCLGNPTKGFNGILSQAIPANSDGIINWHYTKRVYCEANHRPAYDPETEILSCAN